MSKWTIKGVTARVHITDGETEQTVILRSGDAWPLGAEGRPGTPNDKPAPKPKKADPAAPTKKKSEDAKPEALEWKEREEGGRIIQCAWYHEGRFKIVPAGKRHVLFFEWEDGSYRDFKGGSIKNLKWTAQNWLTNPLNGFKSFREYLREVKRPDGVHRLAASAEPATLEWTKTETKGSVTYAAGLPRRGKFVLSKAPKEKKYTLAFHPVDGDATAMGTFEPPRALSKAKKKAQDEARAMLGLKAGRVRKGRRTQKVGETTLTWDEETEDGRRVCIAAAGDGEFNLVETTTGAFALFFIKSEGDIERLGCGKERVMKKKAETEAKRKRKKQDKTAAAKPEAKSEGSNGAPPESSASAKDPTEADKQETAMKDLGGVLDAVLQA